MLRHSAHDGPPIGGHRADGAIAALAARQHGTVSFAQLRELGLSAKAIRSRVARAHLHPVLPGVFAVGHPRLTPDGRLMAAVLAYPQGAVVSHRTAGAYWQLLPLGRGPVEVIADVSTERRGTRHHRLNLDPRDLTTREGIPLTRPGRTLADLATTVPRPLLTRAVHAATIRRLLDQHQIDRALATSAERAGAEHLRELLAELDPKARLRSELERRFQALVRESALPPAELNYELRLEGHHHEVDAAWPGRRLAVELDSRQFHDTPFAQEDDFDRDARLIRCGWRVVRFTWRQVTSKPETVLATLSSLLISTP